MPNQVDGVLLRAMSGKRSRFAPNNMTCVTPGHIAAQATADSRKVSMEGTRDEPGFGP